MALLTVAPPAQLAVSLDEVKAQLRIDDTSQDALVASYIKAATRMAEHETGQRFVTQTLAAVYDAFPESHMALGAGPVQSIENITYCDTEGALQTMSSTDYVLDAAQSLGAGYVMPSADAGSWPDTYETVNAVTCRFVVGYGPDSTTTPDSARAWIMLCVSQLYSGCADLGPMRWHPLLDDLRIYR